MPHISDRSPYARTRIQACFATLLLCASTALFAFPHTTEAATTLSRPPNNLGLVGYWSFNEGTSTKATDFSGNGNTGTLTTTGAALPTWVNGKRGKALNFGGDDYVTAGNINALETGDMSFSQWVKFDALSGTPRWIVQQWTADTGPAFFTGTSNELVFQMGENGPGSISTVTTLTTGRWYHLVATAQGTTLTIYIDGVQAAQGTVTRSESEPTEAFTMGGPDGEGGVSALTGTMDEVRIYNRALGASAVAALAKTGAVKFTTSSVNLQVGSTLGDGLVGLWTFDGPDTTDKIYDRSGSNNHGYFYNGATSSAKTIGKLGQALNFDGTSNAVVTSSIDLSGTQVASVAFWGKFPSFQGADFQNPFYKPRVSPDEAAPQFALEFDNNAGDDCTEDPPRIVVYGGGNTVLAGDCYAPPSVNTWHHFVAIYDKSGNPDTRALYIDGILQTPGSVSGGNNADDLADTPFYIGAYNNGAVNSQFVNGTIDDVRIYNRALSPAEIQQLYKLGTVIIRP